MYHLALKYSHSIYVHFASILFIFTFNTLNLNWIYPIKCLTKHKNMVRHGIWYNMACIRFNLWKCGLLSVSFFIGVLQFQHVQYCLCNVHNVIALFLLYYKIQMCSSEFFRPIQKILTLLFNFHICWVNERVLSFPTGSLCITSVFRV